jgi:hypothetical protein
MESLNFEIFEFFRVNQYVKERLLRRHAELVSASPSFGEDCGTSPQ